MALGAWGHRWIDSEPVAQEPRSDAPDVGHAPPSRPTPLPPRRCTIHFRYPELAARKCYWLVVEGRDVDLCSEDPGFEVDLYVETSVRIMTMVWMGLTTIRAEREAGRLHIEGDCRGGEIACSNGWG